MQVKVLSNSLAEYRIVFRQPLIRVWTQELKHLLRIKIDAELDAETHTAFVREIGKTCSYIDICRDELDVVELAILTHPESKFELSNETYLLRAEKRKPNHVSVNWFSEIEELSYLVRAVKNISETVYDWNGRADKGRSDAIIHLRAYFSKSIFRTALQDDYKSHLLNVNAEVLCSRGSSDLIIHAANCHYDENYDGNLLMCFKELLKRQQVAQETAEISTTLQFPLNERKPIYEDDMTNLSYIAREEGRFGSISYHDNHSEESSGEENENDFWDEGISVFAQDD